MTATETAAGERTLDGRVVLVTGAPRRITPEERATLEQYLEPEEPRRELSAAGSSQHVYPVRVRWSDLDTYHHVNNVKHVEYFQEARIDLGFGGGVGHGRNS